MIFRNKKREQKKITESVFRLYVDKRAYNTDWFQWVAPVASESKRLWPWMRFIKWFHGRDESGCHDFTHSKGSLIVKRENILGYSVEIRERLETS